MTTFELKTFVITENTDKFTSRARCSIQTQTSYIMHTTFSEVWQTNRFQTAKLTFKITQGHWLWCHSI